MAEYTFLMYEYELQGCTGYLAFVLRYDTIRYGL